MGAFKKAVIRFTARASLAGVAGIGGALYYSRGVEHVVACAGERVDTSMEGHKKSCAEVLGKLPLLEQPPTVKGSMLALLARAEEEGTNYNDFEAKWDCMYRDVFQTEIELPATPPGVRPPDARDACRGLFTSGAFMFERWLIRFFGGYLNTTKESIDETKFLVGDTVGPFLIEGVTENNTEVVACSYFTPNTVHIKTQVFLRHIEGDKYVFGLGTAILSRKNPNGGSLLPSWFGMSIPLHILYTRLLLASGTTSLTNKFSEVVTWNKFS